MKAAIEGLVDFILITLLILICVSFVSMHLNEQGARKFHSLAVDKVENSNFSDGVIDAIKEEAKRQGYMVEIDKNQINGGETADVTLHYSYSVPLLNIIDVPNAIRGVAR
ncbi:hypothetical protein LQZ18_18000 [Lachnospiraceae bacterium ZAX-1]